MEDENRQDKEGEVKAQWAREDLNLNSSFFTQMAESMRLQGHYEEAIETLKSGLERMPDALPGRLLLGRCYLEKGMIPEAKKELERVAKGVEECLPVYKMLSKVYLEEKDVDKALEILRKTLYFQTAEDIIFRKATPLEMDLLHRGPYPPFAVPPPPPVTPPPAVPPGVPREPTQEERLRQQGEEKEAKAVIQTDTMAEIYIKQGHLDRALAVYQEILIREPGNAGIRGKCESLKERIAKEHGAKARRKVQARLEGWLAVIASREGPTSP